MASASELIAAKQKELQSKAEEYNRIAGEQQARMQALHELKGAVEALQSLDSAITLEEG